MAGVTRFVRPAAPADADAIARLEVARGLVPDEVRPAIRRELEGIAAGNPLRYSAVAVIDGQVVGYGRLGWRDDGALPAGWYLTGVLVAPAHRRRGIARALVGHRLDLLRALGADEVRSFTQVTNRASIAMHAALGFVEEARGVIVPGVSSGAGSVLFRRALVG